eukprot:523367-Pelagomonas_calceolata.AAC.6
MALRIQSVLKREETRGVEHFFHLVQILPSGTMMGFLGGQEDVQNDALGGFSKWVKEGLPVETAKADYEAGQIDVLNDNLEVVAARVSVEPVFAAIVQGEHAYWHGIFPSCMSWVQQLWQPTPVSS